MHGCLVSIVNSVKPISTLYFSDRGQNGTMTINAVVPAQLADIILLADYMAKSKAFVAKSKAGLPLRS